jgi:ubiquinone/menaquinone biosynthesis C-methylase UbiE
MTRREIHTRLFNRIALPYSWFFSGQTTTYAECFEKARWALPEPSGKTALDIGCGTGAFTNALCREGWEVRGVDAAEEMTKRGRIAGLECHIGDALEGLGFPDKTFDLVSAAYVAHGLVKADRIALFSEMKRLSRGIVLVHDYNGNRGMITSFVEALEGGDYFNFIKTGIDDFHAVFSSVRVLDVGKRSAWYICIP